MEKVYIGKIVNTFGIKGELKVHSTFEMPEKVFKKDTKIIINDDEHLITNVRYHKDHYLVQIDNLDDINLVLIYKGYSVFINRDKLDLDNNDYLMDDLLNMEVYNQKDLVGTVTELINTKLNPLIKINNKFYIPINANYIVKVDINNNKIICENIEELML